MNLIPTGSSTFGNLISCPVLIQVMPIRFTRAFTQLASFGSGNRQANEHFDKAQGPHSKLALNDVTNGSSSLEFGTYQRLYYVILRRLKSFGLPTPERRVRSAGFGAIASEFPIKTNY